MFSRAILRTSARVVPRQTLSVRYAGEKAEMSIQQWLKMEPALEQVIFVLMGGLAAIIVAQLFGASPPTALPAGAPTYPWENPPQVSDAAFGSHPVEKIVMEELGLSSYEEAKPYLKAWWAEQLAEMSEDEIKALKTKYRLWQ
ncbi:Oidioi.mRNA.OKI2018_I69.XSR.g16813.t1.cds [Oikopleura dioica]|uniref:Oidioi.mRNA.OKI2018_I69.XSR.g16813.t1.cds n=1 Tax=Oikopleura dioica TaxID=34765 RepID=A0ABN7SHS3_OIKDI|nr:Oidioi.mRNA.OKI2018_I69.XSR.g16813.t1.cds [Oikopleura dioica]